MNDAVLMTYDGIKDVVDRLARKYAIRLRSCRTKAVDIEDIRSEVWIAWTVACSHFNPDAGVPFLAYFQLGAQHHLNRFLKVETHSSAMTPMSLNDTVDDEDEIGTFFVANEIDPVDTLIAEENWCAVMKTVSPATRRILQLLKDPPLELFAEVEAQQKRVLHARSMGIQTTASKSITVAMLLDFLCYTRTQRKVFHKEVNEAIKEVNQK